MAKTFDSTPDFTQSLELAAYAATPLLMVGLTALFPVLWFVVLAGLAALSYSVYLLIFWCTNYDEYSRRKRLYLLKLSGHLWLGTHSCTYGC